MIDGEKYNLLQFHFYTSFEHTINKKYFDTEMCFVYKTKDGKLSVVGIFIKAAQENKNFKNIIAYLPENKSEAK